MLAIRSGAASSCLAGALLALMVADLAAMADEYPAPVRPESAKAGVIAELLRGKAFKGSDAAYFGEGAVPEWSEPGWCAAALDAFRTGHGITHVEPIARAERYDDPVFKPWQDRCPTLAMNGMPYDGMRYGTRGFTLYRVDLDNDPRNGEEIIFYTERVYSPIDDFRPLPPADDRNWNEKVPPQQIVDEVIYHAQQHYNDQPFYNLLDLDRCVSDEIADTQPRFDYLPRLPVGNVSGIVRYRGRFYLYRLARPFDDPGMPYQFTLGPLTRTEGTTGINPVCQMKEVLPEQN